MSYNNIFIALCGQLCDNYVTTDLYVFVMYAEGRRIITFIWNLKFAVQVGLVCDNNCCDIAFANSECWLAKSCVDTTLCQHGKFSATLLLKFFVLYCKRNTKHFFLTDIQLYQHSWKLEKNRNCVKSLPHGHHVSTQFLVFPICTHVDITVYQHIFVKNDYNAVKLFGRLGKMITCRNEEMFLLEYLMKKKKNHRYHFTTTLCIWKLFTKIQRLFLHT